MKKLLGIVVLGLLLSGNAEAHSGRTNSEGCHNQKSNNTYHCHKSKSYSKKNTVPGSLRIVDGDTIHIGKKNIVFLELIHLRLNKLVKKTVYLSTVE